MKSPIVVPTEGNTEYDCFQRMLHHLGEAEAAANQMYEFRPDQDWRAVAATLNLTQAAIRKAAGAGRVKN